MDEKKLLNEVKRFSYQLRREALQMVYKAKASHIGSCFSVADILAHLFSYILEPTDHFILSKGHATAIYYSALALKGYFSLEHLSQYQMNGSLLGGHAEHFVPGVEWSTGSLGHGLSVGLGMAYAEMIKGEQNIKTVVLLSDGECNEGSVWEAALLMNRLKPKNLLIIVDYNQLQGMGRVDEILPLESLKDKWESFGHLVWEIDGHNHQQIYETLQRSKKFTSHSPLVLLAHTIKGKGVSFMENQLSWHYRSPTNDEFEMSLLALKESYEK